jgi:O-antigen/teichoic acid export membrane protein
MQADKARVAASFCHAVKLLMLVACPLYLGMAAAAAPLVGTLFGSKWLGMVPYVQLLALAMPFLTLQVMFPPVCNAMGRPGLSARIALIGAIIMPSAFLIGIRFGAIGLAMAWVCAYPLFAIATALIAGRIIHLDYVALIRAIMPGALSALIMASIVAIADTQLPPLSAPLHLAMLVAIGAASFFAILALVSRQTIHELIALVVRREAPATEEASAEPARQAL